MGPLMCMGYFEQCPHPTSDRDTPLYFLFLRASFFLTFSFLFLCANLF
jgi:hypothetical protein